MTNSLKKTVAFAEIASAIAVVVTLVFVGIQIRHSAEQTAANTQSLKVNAYQDLISRIADINVFLLENPGFIDLESKVHTLDSNLTELEQSRYNSFLWLLFRHGDMAYYQFEQGVITEARFLSALGPLENALASPVVRARWAQIKSNFVQDYQSCIDGLIAPYEP